MQVRMQTQAADEKVILPLKPGLYYNMLVDWGDGTDFTKVISASDPQARHTYASSGTYTITIYGVCEGFGLEDASHPYKAQLISVETFGQARIKDLSYAFYQTPNLVKVGGGTLTSLESLDFAFKDAPAINFEELRDWDTSSLKTMEDAFANSAASSAPIENWNTSNVVNMRGLFKDNADPIADVSKWNTGRVENMSDTFARGVANPNLRNWDVRNVKNMNHMFGGNTTANPDVSLWNTSNLETMSYMFSGARTANPDVSNWQTGKVTTFQGLFSSTDNANPNVSNWDTSKVTNMAGMFHHAAVANPNTSNWDTSQVTNLGLMFHSAPLANPDVSGWDTSKVTNMAELFNRASSANPDVSGWRTPQVTDMRIMFTGISSQTRLDLSQWDFRKISSADNFPCTASESSPIQMNTDPFTDFLINLDSQNIDPAVVSSFNITSSTYKPEAAAAKQSLADKGWGIGGQVLP